MLNSKFKAYAILIIVALLMILGTPLLYFALTASLSEKEFVISMAAIIPTVLIGFIYAIWYMRKNFGPEWYRIEADIPPGVRKSPRVRAFKYAGLTVLIIGLALGSWFKDPVLALFFMATGYIIMYQGAKEETKFLPPAARRPREIGYRIILLL
ncbi:MAG: hypothetical protein QXU42_00010 [Thermoproteota archaeon]